jgi:hypothetical protein
VVSFLVRFGWWISNPLGSSGGTIPPAARSDSP